MESLFDMLEVEEIKPVEKKKKESKKEAKVEKTEKKEKASASSKSYLYPFVMHISAQNIDVSHIFEDGKEYSEKEITKMMLEHGFYNFSGNVTYDFIESDNVLVPIFQYHKKG